MGLKSSLNFSLGRYLQNLIVDTCLYCLTCIFIGKVEHAMGNTVGKLRLTVHLGSVLCPNSPHS